MIPASDQIAETALLEVSRTQRRAFETMSETPADGFGAGHLEYQIRVNFRDLCRLIGKEAGAPGDRGNRQRRIFEAARQ
jgi:hypothetical protein